MNSEHLLWLQSYIARHGGPDATFWGRGREAEPAFVAAAAAAGRAAGETFVKTFIETYQLSGAGEFYPRGFTGTQPASHRLDRDDVSGE